ncbi:hypothetical protein K435DRAFT_845040 [Dendrothele bispora CBS 962.96]|uniref:Uncharacterized protein n=1 Tax=Dendrothele bispora (strain CBS 962.96) TaxID=1314807 RepID=A0A4S8KX80_DENBC|nr:hypothetical protein K435DRAFT_845040 [Dendrothele bispora CBS 962.96]
MEGWLQGVLLYQHTQGPGGSSKRILRVSDVNARTSEGGRRPKRKRADGSLYAHGYINNIKLLEFFAVELARANQMAYTRSNNPRLDDDARHLTQDYPAFGENLSRASSRSSTVSQASRTTYPGVPEDILERVSQAKTARLAARARYEAALANPDLPNSVITKLEDNLSKCEDELKFARIERTRAKFSSQHTTSSRPLLPAPLPAPAPPQYPPKSLLQPVTEDLDLFLERGEELEKLGHKVNVEGGCENGRTSTTTNQIDLARTECDSTQLLDQRAATLPGRSLHPSIPVSPLLQIATRFSSHLRNMPFLEWGEEPRRRILNQGAGSKMGEEVGIAGGREERTRSVHDGRVQLPGHYEHEGRSRTFVPLDREQYMYLPNALRTATGPRTQPLRDQDEREVQHHVPLTVVTHQSRTPQPLAHHQEQPGVNSPPPPINYASRPLRSPPVFVTTSTRGSVSWIRPRDLITPVQHIVGGFGGGGDSEGSSYYESSESDHGNGGGGRPPGWWDDDPGDPDHNDEGRSDDRQPRRGRHGKDRDNEPRRGPCGGGPPGGDPPDDGEPEGGKDGNSERSNRKDSKKKRGVTPFSEIPEEGSPHYHYEYFEYKPKPPTSLKKPLKEKVFTRFVTLIEWRLFTKLKVVGDGKAQRNLINSIPKVELYKGQNSIVVLDRFLRNLIRHMEVHGLTGPPKAMDSEGTLVVTHEDMARTILMAGNLTGVAQEWYQNFAERPPSSFRHGMKANAHRRTFLQVFRALFDRFITGTAVKEAEMLYEEVEYTTEGGICRLLADMKMYAEIMPVPPDEYRFKDSLMQRLPQYMRRIILCDGISAIDASLDEVMQRALAIESGWEAEVHYDTTGSQLNVSEPETDTGSEESESEETQKQGDLEPESGETQEQGELEGAQHGKPYLLISRLKNR